MKTIKQFREEYDNIVLEQVQVAPDELMLEGRESSAIKPMPKTIPSFNEMPTMLMFRRIAYRTYPNKQVVALYYSKYVDKYLSIPFGPDGNLNLSEAIVLDEGAGLEALKGGLKGAAKGAFKGHIFGAAVAGAPGAGAGTLAGGVIGAYKGAKKAYNKAKEQNMEEDWSDTKHQNPTGGLKKSGVMAYRREHPGSKLQTAVTTKPSKLKKGSKAANRRKSFCARMGGMKKRLTSAKTARDPDSRINKALRKWNCEESFKSRLSQLRESRVDEGWRDTLIDIGKSMPGYGDKEESKKRFKRGDYFGAIKSQGKALGKAALTGLATAAGVGLAARALPTALGAAAGAAATKAAAPSSSSSQTDSDPAMVRRKPEKVASSSMRAKSSRAFAPQDKMAPTQQTRYTASMMAKENKISDIQNMINEGIDNMDLSINGRTVTLNNSMAKKIIRVYESVNNKNKKIVENMLNEDLDSFKKLLNFSIKA